MELRWHPYKYYPYERELALREIAALISPHAIESTKDGVRLSSPRSPEAAERLVYFSSSGPQSVPTLQSRLERINGNGPNRQSTRYSAHGLHEYKGKFNPQIAKAILNIFGVPSGSRVLDPFCGSGTSLIEATHLGMEAYGVDINPLAVFLANAKIASLRLDLTILRKEFNGVVERQMSSVIEPADDERGIYLASWFDISVLRELERLRIAIFDAEPSSASVLVACASDLLRDYSLQDPMDLRIRRRKTPLPEKPFMEAFKEAVERFIFRTQNAREIILPKLGNGKALHLNSRELSLSIKELEGVPFDCALTSPPYAMALPYIDTQRLSLIWLGLSPKEINPLEARLVGSRELRGLERKATIKSMLNNESDIPEEQYSYCLSLQDALNDNDGFRRQAVPVLLYRYFSSMAESFGGVRSVMRVGAPYALIVGGNHTVLGGRRFDINTPAHLASVAERRGWRLREMLPLQTYQRYGYHMNNAVANEAMVILEAV